MPWAMIPWQGIGFPAKQYITIVNLTPHRFILDRRRTHSYQMDTFDFDDIPQGRARQNTAEYAGGLTRFAVDDGGEAYYTIQGTSQRFEVRARTHMDDLHRRRTIFDLTGMGLGQREYLDPGKETAVTLVITGSESYGFIASLRHPEQGRRGRGGSNWMRGLYDVIKDRQLQHVVVPAAHDAGMSRISGAIASVGTAANTQTQGLSIYHQLRAGARLFDLRIGSVHQLENKDDYAFWTLHVSNERADVVLGNSGEALDHIIDDVNRFTAESPGEIIVFRVRYLIGMYRIPVEGPIYWTADIMDAFLAKLRRVNYRCPNLSPDVPFNRQKAAYFMDRNHGAGCVLFLLNGDNLGQDGAAAPAVPRASVPDGIYPASWMDIWDNWSNLPHTDAMAADQVSAWKGMPRNASALDDAKDDRFLLSQWLVSADIITTTALTIQNIAVLPTNPALYWMGLNHMSPERFPSAILVDYLGVVVPDQWSWERGQLSAEMYTLAIGLNLYMVSENCDISPRKSPLLPRRTRKAVMSSANTATAAPKTAGRLASRALSSWNGIIFANGTVMDDPPPTLHVGRVAVLKAGSRFMNGTVVRHAVPNHLAARGLDW